MNMIKRNIDLEEYLEREFCENLRIVIANYNDDYYFRLDYPEEASAEFDMTQEGVLKAIEWRADIEARRQVEERYESVLKLTIGQLMRFTSRTMIPGSPVCLHISPRDILRCIVPEGESPGLAYNSEEAELMKRLIRGLQK